MSQCNPYYQLELCLAIILHLRWLNTVFQGQYPNHNKFSPLSNTTVVSIFPNLCLWRCSLCSNLGGIDPEKLYPATLKLQDQVGKEL